MAEELHDLVKRIGERIDVIKEIASDISPTQSKQLKSLIKDLGRLVTAVNMDDSMSLIPEKKISILMNALRLMISGKNADDIGNQCGGWTITWQGSSGNITDGTTILQGIKKAVSSETKVTYSFDGSGAEGADVAIAVLGGRRFAEKKGDRQDLSLDSDDLRTLENLRKANVPTVVILITGRPLIITEQLDSMDALLVAWLPGTEGDGIADVLFGDFSPKGKLPVSWPRDMSQIPINIGDENYDPLFPYGFGLTY